MQRTCRSARTLMREAVPRNDITIRSWFHASSTLVSSLRSHSSSK